jgi:surfeit locus 1 family protein
VTLARRDWAGLAVALGVAAGCVRLGIWQLQRLGERRARNAAVRAARRLPPLAVTAGFTAAVARDRRLYARGVYDYAHERLWHGRSYEGVPGVDLVTPLRLADGAAVLVDRGWVPSPDGFHVDAGAYREGERAEVWGLGVAAPRAPGDVDPVALAESLPYPLLPFVLQQLPADTSGAGAAGGAGGAGGAAAAPRVHRWPAPPLSDGPHLSYAIQWFSFAVIIVVGSVALARKRAREQAAARGTETPAR